MTQKIEILSTHLLDQHRPVVNDLRRLAQALSLEFGWHYLLDLTWILSELGSPTGKTIMDAGAGVGVMQWFLAEQGAEVFSVDRTSRADLAARFRSRYQVNGLRTEDLNPVKKQTQKGSPLSSLTKSVKGAAKQIIYGRTSGQAAGSVKIYNEDLKTLTNLPDESCDAVVAVSALEHNPKEDLPLVVAELMRVLKPGGKLLATLCAAREQDWFHAPSQGWCYTAESIKQLFDLPANTPDNYHQYDLYFDDLKNNAELRENLASFYTRSADNGMPWGKWAPQYQPVGVCKIKE